jgi:hypothetical protein
MDLSSPIIAHYCTSSRAAGVLEAPVTTRCSGYKEPKASKICMATKISSLPFLLLRQEKMPVVRREKQYAWVDDLNCFIG